MDRHSQLIKGVLDMCLLALIAEGPTYGYDMIRQFQDRGVRLGTEGSIYPRLAVLQDKGWVTTTKQASPDGPVRKYYQLTPAGRRQIEDSVAEWREFADSVDLIVKEFS